MYRRSSLEILGFGNLGSHRDHKRMPEAYGAHANLGEGNISRVLCAYTVMASCLINQI